MEFFSALFIFGFSGCPGTHSADQAVLKLRDLSTSASSVLPCLVYSASKKYETCRKTELVSVILSKVAQSETRTTILSHISCGFRLLIHVYLYVIGQQVISEAEERRLREPVQTRTRGLEGGAHKGGETSNKNKFCLKHVVMKPNFPYAL